MCSLRICRLQMKEEFSSRDVFILFSDILYYGCLVVY